MGFSGRITRAFCLVGCMLVHGCTEFPEIAAMEGPAAPPPALVPLEGLLPQTEPQTDPQTDPAPALTARADALRARAGTIGAP